MKVLLLAAGKGQRMQPDSLNTPKPLLFCGKHRLIEHHLYNLAKAGYREVFINLSYRSQDFYPILGNGSKYKLKIHYVFEPTGGYEAGGTIINSLSYFGKEQFLMISADIYTNLDLKPLQQLRPKIAHLLLTQADSGLFNFKNNQITGPGNYNYASIGVFNPAAFIGWPKQCKIKLKDILLTHLKNNTTLDASLLPENNIWHNITTHQQLKTVACTSAN